MSDGDHTPKSDLHALRRAYHQASEAGDLIDAAKAAWRLAEAQPDKDAAWRLAANAAFQAGDLPAARDAAERAVVLDPQSMPHRIFAAKMQLRGEDHSAALVTLTPVMEWPDRSAEVYHVAAQAAEGVGDRERALDWARTAWVLQPERPTRGLAFAQLLQRLDRFDEAETILQDVAEDPEARAVALRGLSALALQRGAVDVALEQIDAALALEPERIDFVLHRVGVLRKSGRVTEARRALEQVLAERPDDLRLKRTLTTVLTQAGDHDEAMRHSAELLAAAPNDQDYLSIMQSLLQRRGDLGPTGADGPDIASLKRGAEGRILRARPTFRTALRRTGEVIGALVMRDIRTRYGRNRLSFLWALLEPLAHIAVLAVIFVIMQRSNPPLGDNYLLFYFTGVQAYLLFSSVAQRAGGGVLAGRGLMGLPQITPLDILISRTIVEILIATVTVVVLGLVLTVLTGRGLPVNLPIFVVAFSLSVLLGVGFGALLAVLRMSGRAVDLVVRALLRLLYLASGVFFIPGGLPSWIRDILLWNPMMHVVDLWRVAYFKGYTGPFTSASYPAMVALALLVVGLATMMAATPAIRSYK